MVCLPLEQYLNIYFAGEDEQLHRQRSIFDAEDIFEMYVPPYEEQEICASYTIPQGAHLVRIGSHVHQRGVKFRVWYPPNDPDCSPSNDCQPNEDEPFYTSCAAALAALIFLAAPRIHLKSASLQGSQEGIIE